MSKTPDDLPPLREVIASHSLGAKKTFGQHFLLDLNLTSKIARAAAPLEETTFIEVGPGPGGLTRALLAEGAAQVIAIEKDPRFLDALNEVSQAYDGRLEVIQADALGVDEATLNAKPPVKLVSNLPYNVGTQLLIKWLTEDPWPPWFQSLTLMFQKEVADRIVGLPGTKSYGRLAVLSQWRCEVKKLFDVPARAFTPPPKVDSSVVQLIPKPDLSHPELLNELQQITASAFGQRRKMLRASLKQVSKNAEGLCITAGIDPTARAEQLSLDEFLKLANQLRFEKKS